VIAETIADADAMEVDDLGTIDRGKTGFGSGNLNPKQAIMAKEERIKIFLLHAEKEHKNCLVAPISAITLC